ncbi:hypothetical protein Droror1_Dr00021650 [Drosera rotundifolia]
MSVEVNSLQVLEWEKLCDAILSFAGTPLGCQATKEQLWRLDTTYEESLRLLDETNVTWLRWQRLEDRNGDKVKGELMLAVWWGSQADEAFTEAWFSDAAAVSGPDALANIHSKVYLSPKLWYLRVKLKVGVFNVIIS